MSRMMKKAESSKWARNVVAVVTALSLVFMQTPVTWAVADQNANSARSVATNLEEEIAQVNTAFEPIVNHAVNPLGLFLMSWYQSPEWLDLTEFLRYFPDSQTVTDSAEFEALKAHQNWSWPKDATLDRMPVPIHRIEAQKADALLRQYMGVTIEDITYHPSSDLIYLEEYDCYYNFTSDAGFGSFTCIGGDITGGTLTLRGTDSILTLWLADDSWMIHSFMPDFSSHYSSEEK